MALRQRPSPPILSNHAFQNEIDRWTIRGRTMTTLYLFIELATTIVFPLVVLCAIALTVFGVDTGEKWFEGRYGKKPLDYLGLDQKWHKKTYLFLMLLGFAFGANDLYLRVISWFSRPPLSRCVQQIYFDAAVEGGVDGLSAYVRECQSENGPLLKAAKAELVAAREDVARQTALNCFDFWSSSTSCNAAEFNVCLTNYASTSATKQSLQAFRQRLQDERDSTRCKPAPGEPPLSPCFQADLDNATAGGAGALRAFIKNCRVEDGALLEQAYAALRVAEENAGYQKALACFQAQAAPSACAADSLKTCLNAYEIAFPSGNHLSELREALKSERESPRCNPRSQPVPSNQQSNAPEALLNPTETPDPATPPKAMQLKEILRRSNIDFEYTYRDCDVGMNGQTTQLRNGNTDTTYYETLHLDENDKLLLTANKVDGLGSFFVDLKRNSTESRTLWKIGANVGGVDRIVTINVPYEASARIDESEVTLAFSMVYKGVFPGGSTGTMSHRKSVHLSASSQTECRVVESTLEDTSRNLSVYNGHQEIYCGPEITRTSCKIRPAGKR
jgi:hypothetical protein